MRESLLKLFQKRWFAIALCVVCMIATTLLNTRVKLGGQCEDLIGSFYDTGSDELSIGSQLQSICNAATGLTAIAGHYSLDSSAATEATEDLRLAMQYSRSEASFIHSDYLQLLDVAEELIGRLEQAQLSKRDAENLTLYTEAIDQARSNIEASSYNTEVAAFRRANIRFPAEGLAAFAGVEMPQLFQ